MKSCLTDFFCLPLQGKKLLMLKNPWNHLRWKGRFSENDAGSWTPDLQKELNYDPKSAQTYDNGENLQLGLESVCYYSISPVIRQFFHSKTISKNLDPSYKMDLYLWDCLGRVKLVLQRNFIGLISLFVVISERGNPVL